MQNLVKTWAVVIGLVVASTACGMSRKQPVAPVPVVEPVPALPAEPVVAPEPKPLPTGPALPAEPIQPAPAPIPAPPATEPPFVELSPNSTWLQLNWGKPLALEAVRKLNLAFTSGCVKEEVLKHVFLTRESDILPTPKNSEEVYARLIKGAPHKIEPRWYYKKFGSTVGYTYFWYDNIGPSAGTEYRIWTNTKKCCDNSDDLASHWGHETSHQAHSGAFGHWTVHPGSVPYDLGDLIYKCVIRLNARLNAVK